MPVPKQTEFKQETTVWEDYPVNKFGKKIDWWTSDKGLELIAGWRAAGATIKEIYEKMGVDVRTFRVWRKKCPELDEIMAVGRDIANTRVENALFRKAVGFYYEEEVYELIEGEMRLTKRYKRYCPPDVKACLHYLYNRKYEDWRAVQQPIDVNLESLGNADDILIKIKQVAESASETAENALSLNSEDEEVLTPDSDNVN